MKKKLLYFLLNPIVLAGLISSIIIWFLPEYFSKYLITLQSKEFVYGENNFVYYSDLDNDSRSERIETMINALGKASFMFSTSDGDLVDQYNVEGVFPLKPHKIWFQDGDGNGRKEIYFITRQQDSAFLNVFELKNEINDFSVEKVFVDTLVAYNGEYNIGFINVFEKGERNESKGEVMFSILAGFSCYPRFVYKYDFEIKKIIKSPYLVNPTTVISKMDLDRDAKMEYLTISHSPGNDNATKYSPRSDYSTWLSVLDDNLDFLFPPIEFKSLGTIQSLSSISNSGDFIISLYNSSQYNKLPSKLLKVNLEGNVVQEIKLPKGYYTRCYIYEDNYILYDRKEGNFLIYDSNLNFKRKLQLLPDLEIYYVDINGDGHEEWLGINQKNNHTTIWDQNLEHPVTFQFMEGTPTFINNMWGIKWLNKADSQIYFQKENELRYFSYHENPLYYLKYFIYIGIYATILLVIWLILKGQKLREANKRALEQKISDLQLKTIKNQVDPHFVFNAINTISEMTLMDNKLEADQFICEFSDLMRKTLNRSDKITTTLEDELAYVENYLRLQQIRHKNNFDFQIDVSKEVNPKQLIPKHTVYTFVENAVKYGLPKDTQGTILVEVVQAKDSLLIKIEDNGKGILENTDNKYSTGSGLKIIQQIFELYTRRFGTKIEYSLCVVKDENNKVLGTCAEINLRQKNTD